MEESVSNMIMEAVRLMIENTSSPAKQKKLEQKHAEKIHFIPKKYRVFGGMLQSMNIQYGNFIEQLMALLIKNDGRYELALKYSGVKSNAFKLSLSNDTTIDAYISRCQTEGVGYCETAFPELLQSIVSDEDDKLQNLSHDIDLLFRDKATGTYYYVEVKYNDDHDTGKFVDINRKFIKTYAYLARELAIEQPGDLVPILFFFNNKRMKGNIYIPEGTCIKRGKTFFDEFLHVDYGVVNSYMADLSESPSNVALFDGLYEHVVGRR